MITKRIMSIVLATIMIMSIVPMMSISVSAEASNEIQSVEYTLSDDGTYYIVSDYIGTEADIIIPSVYNGLPVTTIGDYAFFNSSVLRSVVIPDSVTKIGYNAFYNCTNLQFSVYDNAKYLGNSANPYYALIEDVSSDITSCDIHSDTIVISDYAFVGNSSLTNVIVGDSVVYIGEYAFRGCASLNSIQLSNSIISIGKFAFFGCYRLSYNIYDNAKYLGNEFNQYIALIEPVSKEISTCNVHPNARVIADCAFKKCVYLSNVQISDSVIGIGNEAFYSCGLSSVTIGNSVKSIGNYAFYNCDSLSSITIPDSVCYLGERAFLDCFWISSVDIGDSLVSIGRETFYNCEYLANVVLGNSVESIGTYAFGCTSLTTIDLPNSLINIGEAAFCATFLTNITIPDTVQSIGDDAFSDCYDLSSVIIGNSVKSIGDYAFYNCGSLTSIYIPNSVTSMDHFVFDGCCALKYIYCEADVQPAGWVSNWRGDCSAVIYWSCDSLDAPIVPAESISLKDGTTTIDIDVGEEIFPVFEIYPEDSNDIITLSSSDYSIVGISGQKIYGRKTGSAVVTAKAIGGASFSFNVNVIGISDIEILTFPNKMQYDVGEEFDETGLSVQANYTDGTTQIIDSYTLLGFDSDNAGKQTITIAYDGVTTTFDVLVGVSSIEISNYPKRSYSLDERINTDGLELTLTFCNGTTLTVTDGYTISGFDSTSAGEKTVVVYYYNESVTYTINVSAIKNLTNGNSYTTDSSPSSSYPDVDNAELTDGIKVSDEDITSPYYKDSRWVGYSVYDDRKLDFMVNLGDGTKIFDLIRIEVNVGGDKIGVGVCEPDIIAYYTIDGVNWVEFGKHVRTAADKYAIDVVFNAESSVQATAIKLTFDHTPYGKSLIWVSEVAAYGNESLSYESFDTETEMDNFGMITKIESEQVSTSKDVISSDKALNDSADGEIVYVNDKYYYYENGVGAERGLVKVGDDYYFSGYLGELVVSQEYYAWMTNCDLPNEWYEFGADGKMLQGIVEKEGKYYYYENGRGVEKGLVKVGDDYYFSQYGGEVVATERYYAWMTNCDLLSEWYEFGADGKMLQGIVERDGALYYYENGKGVEKGLFEYNGGYYFSEYAGKLRVSESFYAWVSNCDLPVGVYAFDEYGRIVG